MAKQCTRIGVNATFEKNNRLPLKRSTVAYWCKVYKNKKRELSMYYN